MSIVTEIFLVCDVCLDNFDVDDNKQKTASDQRKMAKAAGWKRGVGGRDFCPKCLKEYYINLKFNG